VNRILFCRSNPIAPDPGVEKEACVLASAGYLVHALGWDRKVALLLSLWSGLILFSGILAQDNWIILPTVALSLLTVRNLVLKNKAIQSCQSFFTQ
jgi:hypothetical protein